MLCVYEIIYLTNLTISCSKTDVKSGQLELTRMPRVLQVETSSAGAESTGIWGQQDSNNPPKNNKKNEEPDQDAEITKK